MKHIRFFQRWNTYIPLILFVLVSGLLVACGAGATPTPPAPTATPVPPTPKPQPTATLKPTATPLPAAAAAVPTPAAAAVPTPGAKPAVVLIPTVPATEAVRAVKPWPGAYPKAGQRGIPTSVEKFTIATDSWGTSELNPWAQTSVSYLGDYFNLRLMMQDPNGQIAAAWATEFEQSEQGVLFKLNPKARFQDGSPADAEALRTLIRGMKGEFVQSSGYTAPLWNSSAVKEVVEDVEVRGPYEAFVKTNGPKPTFMWNLGGIGYHLYWYGNPRTLLAGPEGYEKNPAGGGPYKVAKWEPGSRILFERWDGFWADYPHWHLPQARTMEILTVPDPAARFALLKSGQVDAVYNLPWALAKGLDRSETGVRGVNPGKGGLWTQTYSANGLLALTFGCPLQVREAAKAPGRKDKGGVDIPQWTVPEACQDSPTLKREVRRALNLAIDKKAVAAGPHFGFSKAIGSIFHAGSFASRPEERVNNVSPYNPQEAKRLLADAGYGKGFELTGHFGQFAGRPGIPEMADSIASYWANIGVKVKWQEHDPSDFVRGFRAGVFSQVPVNLQTWGRQEHSGIQINWYHATSGYVGVYDDAIEDLYFKITATGDPEKMQPLLYEFEDKVLGLEETFPLYGMSLVNAYSNRVISHPTVESSPHFKHYDLVLLRD